MITTAEHHKDNIKSTIDADDNAIQEWVKVRLRLICGENVDEKMKTVDEKLLQTALQTNHDNWNANVSVALVKCARIKARIAKPSFRYFKACLVHSSALPRSHTSPLWLVM